MPRLGRGPRRPGTGAVPTIAAAMALAASQLAVGAPSAVVAQVPGVVGVEARAGAAIGSFAPTGAGLELAPAPSWSLAVSWGPSALIGAYAGYSSVGFRCDGGFCAGYDVSFVSRGFSLGLTARAPTLLAPWLRAGVLLHEFEQRWQDPTGGATVDAGLGFEAAAGVTWRLRPQLYLVPGLHVGFLPTRAEDGETDRAFFTGLDLGIRLNL